MCCDQCFVVACHSLQLCSRRRRTAIRQSLNRSQYSFSCIVHQLMTSVTLGRLCIDLLIKVYDHTCAAADVNEKFTNAIRLQVYCLWWIPERSSLNCCVGMNCICTDPEGFNAKRRKTAEQSYTSFMTDFSHLPKTLLPFNGKSDAFCIFYFIKIYFLLSLRHLDFSSFRECPSICTRVVP